MTLRQADLVSDIIAVGSAHRRERFRDRVRTRLVRYPPKRLARECKLYLNVG
jgi:hypothetical protein